jgi:hypothetical protein
MAERHASPWGWLLAAVIWFGLSATAFSQNFFGIGIETPAWMPRLLAHVIVSSIFHFILLGWAIPLGIGVRLAWMRRRS